MSDALDGNAISGELLAAFGREMTAVVGRCSQCGNVAPVAQLRVYVRAPSTVARCPTCHAVVMVLVTIGDECLVHLPALDLPDDV